MGGPIIDCYNMGNISLNVYAALSAPLSLYAGGIAGRGQIITNCYNYGDISAFSSNSAFVGGIAGAIMNGIVGNSPDSYQSTPGTITNSYWNSDSEQIVNGTVQQPQKGAGSGTNTAMPLTSEQMIDIDRYLEWDFTSIWAISSEINDGYPYLQSLNINSASSLTTTTFQAVSSPLPGLRFTIKSEYPLNNADIMLALYDKSSGKLLCLKQTSCNGSDTYIIDTPEYSNVTAKVFVWRGVSVMEPLGFHEIVNIQ